MGALVIERHFTLDKSLPGPDHAASMDPQALNRWVTAIRQVEKSLGDGVKRAMPSEIDTVSVARRSLVVTRDLEPGDAIAEADLTALRPADGISPQLIDQLLGSVVVRPVSEGSALAWEDVGSEGPQ
jgi:N,N'-diacetyllegionaminate synthase